MVSTDRVAATIPRSYGFAEITQRFAEVEEIDCYTMSAEDDGLVVIRAGDLKLVVRFKVWEKIVELASDRIAAYHEVSEQRVPHSQRTDMCSVGYYDYQISRQISATDPPFFALIMAAMRKADTHNAALLQSAFPFVYRELMDRQNAPDGMLTTDGANSGGAE